MSLISTDICVIGAGSGGLSLASGAVQMGADVVLVERGKMGGDCLNYGCVPSKALISASRLARDIRRDGSAFGVLCKQVEIDFERTHKHVRSVIGAIAPHDSEERFRSLGVRVIKGSAEFSGRREVRVGDDIISAKYIVIATGSSPCLPEVAGLSSVPCLTNETIFNLRSCPRHLLILGMGPIGCELGQAFSCLGARVTLLSRGALLSREDSDVREVIRASFVSDKVRLIEGAYPIKFSKTRGNDVCLHYEFEGERCEVVASHLLAAVGRCGNVSALNLSVAGVSVERGAIKVDSRLRAVGNSRIFAIGDVRGGPQFTHMASYDAGIVLRNILFKMRVRADYRFVPRVTYTSPEVASVGLSLSDAESRYGVGAVRSLVSGCELNDRAKCERGEDGFIKVIVGVRGRILGVSIVAKGAGDLLLPWIMALRDGKRIGAMAGYIVPYPTFSELSKRVSGDYFTPKLFSSRVRRLVRFLMRWF